MPSRNEIDFRNLSPCSRVRLVTADEDINLFALDPANGIFVIEYFTGECCFCFVLGSIKDRKLKRRVICPDCQLQIISGEKEFLSPQIIALKHSKSNFGMTQNVFRRASKDADI